tara:strand:- start:1287 stop:1550 length:264 start_codon:yes stop_codon:yes gene_type:complete
MSNSTIRFIDNNGIASSVTGNGTYGFSVDNGLAGNAVLNGPRALNIYSKSNILFTDYINERIRKISTNGIITTIAGGGSCGNNLYDD